MEKKLISFIENELNENGRFNAIAYDDDYFDGAKNIRIVFRRNHLKNYNRLLIFCAENNICVIKTSPATYETIVRVITEG